MGSIDRANTLDSFHSRDDDSSTRLGQTTTKATAVPVSSETQHPRTATSDASRDAFMAFFSQILPTPYTIAKTRSLKDTAPIETTVDSTVSSRKTRPSKPRTSQPKPKGVAGTSKTPRSRRQNHLTHVGKVGGEKDGHPLRNVMPDTNHQEKPPSELSDNEHSVASGCENKPSVSADWPKGDASRLSHLSKVHQDYLDHLIQSYR